MYLYIHVVGGKELKGLTNPKPIEPTQSLKIMQGNHPKSKVQVNIFIYRIHVCIYHKLLSLILNLRYKSTYSYIVHIYVYTTNC